ncbi:MAG: hypothetical protein IH793_12380 [Acidobacteria bacterium]|nr:hypothetical protein [Acidobacteriota bacterium]
MISSRTSMRWWRSSFSLIKFACHSANLLPREPRMRGERIERRRAYSFSRKSRRANSVNFKPLGSCGRRFNSAMGPWRILFTKRRVISSTAVYCSGERSRSRARSNSCCRGPCKCFCKAAMVGATSKVVQDVPPYVISDGNPAMARTINKIGLERAGFSKEEISLARRVFKAFFKDGLNRTQAVEWLREHEDVESPVVKTFLDFTADSQRGLG